MFALRTCRLYNQRKAMKLASARGALYFLCWLVLVGLLLAGITRCANGNLAAVLGALVMWLAGVLGVSWYEIAVIKSPLDGDAQDKQTEAAWNRWRRFFWPMKLMSQFLPGLWIGVESLSPLL